MKKLKKQSCVTELLNTESDLNLCDWDNSQILFISSRQSQVAL